MPALKLIVSDSENFGLGWKNDEYSKKKKTHEKELCGSPHVLYVDRLHTNHSHEQLKYEIDGIMEKYLR